MSNSGLNKRNLILLGMVLFSAGAFRFYGLRWGLPGPSTDSSFHPDEKMAPLVLSRMRPSQGNFDPLYFINPTLYYYQYGFLLWPVSHFAKVTPPWKLKDYTAFIDYDPIKQRVWFITGRVMTAVMGVVTVWGVFWLGSLLVDQRVGIVSAALLAVIPAHVVQSHYMVVDVPAIMWMVLSLCFFVLGLKRGGLLYFGSSGLLLGFGVATKYTTFLVVLPMMVLFVQDAWRRQNNEEWRGKAGAKGKPKGKNWTSSLITQWRFIAVWGALALAGFLIGCPYSLLNHNVFLGAAGLEGIRRYNIFPWNLTRVFNVSFFHGLGLPLMLVSLAGLILLLLRPLEKTFALGVILATNIVLLIVNASPYMRHFVPLTPFLALGSGLLLVELYEGHLFGLGQSGRKWVLVLGALVFLYTAGYSAALVKQMGKEDNRLLCLRWLKENIKPLQITAVIKPEWGDDFYSVPLGKTTLTRVVVSYKYPLFQAYAPDCLILSDYERIDCLGDMEGRELVASLEKSETYKPVNICRRDISFLTLPFPYNPPGFDWLYFCPEITVYGQVGVRDSSRSLYIKGREIYNQGNFPEAIKFFEEAAGSQNLNPLYRLWISLSGLRITDSLWQEKKYLEAFELLDRCQRHTQMALSVQPRIWARCELLGVQAQIRLDLGYVMDALGRPDLAESAFRFGRDDLLLQKTFADSLSNVKVGNWGDNFKTAVMALAGNYKKMRKMQEAEQELNKLLEIDRDYVPGIVMLADIYLRTEGMENEALILLEHALEVKPSLKDEKNSNLPAIIEKLRQKLFTSPR